MRFPTPIAALLLVMALVPSLIAQAPSLGLDRNLGPVRLSVNGEPGYDYTLLGATNDLSPGGWDFLATFTLTEPSASWFDSASAVRPHRFYKTVRTDIAPPEEAPDFRLIDHLGKSRRLHYYEGLASVRAIVLIFTGNGCATIRAMAPAIRSLTNQFNPQGVLVWLIDSNAGDNRSNILVEAASLGFSNGPPILHDSAQVVANAYHAATTPEVVAVETTTWTIFYRGAIDDRLGSNTTATTQSYLVNALDAFLGGATVSPKATRPAGCAITLNPPPTSVSYAADIAPLLQAKCVRCHSPGNIAPWSMTNHNSVRLYAGAIRETVLTGEMPPWHADPVHGRYANDASLTPAESARLLHWIDSGSPRGPGPDPLAVAPTVTNFPYAWPASLGQPTTIYRIPNQNIPATGTVDYRYVNVTNTFFTSNVWLRAAVVRPGNARVVHHSLVFQGTGGLMGLDGFFASYVPGMEPVTYPAGTGKLLRPGEVLRFQMHYTTVGSAQTDRTEIGLYVAPATPNYALQTKSAYNVFFAIPPHTADYQATASYPGNLATLTTNILLYELSPHMHLRGSAFKYEAIYANGTRETLLSVPNYLFHWQTLYRLAQPKYLPRGTRIQCTATWDNTEQNHELMDAYAMSGDTRYLPTDPVTFGEQSYQEMFIGYLNFAEVP